MGIRLLPVRWTFISEYFPFLYFFWGREQARVANALAGLRPEVSLGSRPVGIIRRWPYLVISDPFLMGLLYGKILGPRGRHTRQPGWRKGPRCDAALCFAAGYVTFISFNNFPMVPTFPRLVDRFEIFEAKVFRLNFSGQHSSSYVFYFLCLTFKPN